MSQAEDMQGWSSVNGPSNSAMTGNPQAYGNGESKGITNPGYMSYLNSQRNLHGVVPDPNVSSVRDRSVYHSMSSSQSPPDLAPNMDDSASDRRFRSHGDSSLLPILLRSLNSPHSVFGSGSPIAILTPDQLEKYCIYIYDLIDSHGFWVILVRIEGKMYGLFLCVGTKTQNRKVLFDRFNGIPNDEFTYDTIFKPLEPSNFRFESVDESELLPAAYAYCTRAAILHMDENMPINEMTDNGISLDVLDYYYKARRYGNQMLAYMTSLIGIQNGILRKIREGVLSNSLLHHAAAKSLPFRVTGVTRLANKNEYKNPEFETMYGLCSILRSIGSRLRACAGWFIYLRRQGNGVYEVEMNIADIVLLNLQIYCADPSCRYVFREIHISDNDDDADGHAQLLIYDRHRNKLYVWDPHGRIQDAFTFPYWETYFQGIAGLSTKPTFVPDFFPAGGPQYLSRHIRYEWGECVTWCNTFAAAFVMAKKMNMDRSRHIFWSQENKVDSEQSSTDVKYTDAILSEMLKREDRAHVNVILNRYISSVMQDTNVHEIKNYFTRKHPEVYSVKYSHGWYPNIKTTKDLKSILEHDRRSRRHRKHTDAEIDAFVQGYVDPFLCQWVTLSSDPEK